MLEGRQPNVMAGRFLQSGAILHTSPFTFTTPFILQMMIPKWSLLQIEALQFTQIYSRALSSSRPYQALKKFLFNVDDSHASPFTFTTLYFYKQAKTLYVYNPLFHRLFTMLVILFPLLLIECLPSLQFFPYFFNIPFGRI